MRLALYKMAVGKRREQVGFHLICIICDPVVSVCCGSWGMFKVGIGKIISGLALLISVSRCRPSVVYYTLDGWSVAVAHFF